ncbi:hypothetical protein OC842_005863 [Tilletia horrida]|uniref:DNA helicase n=1 Tax=Tilletia horrida TaxID=155126 RepID=A0AAN6G6L1_9BASI|nr:hypothetical protein OC842_005863 [Tilletia horrida]
MIHSEGRGINVLFAGDLCQLPPVASATLYARGASSALNAETRTLVELGQTAWLHVDEVVEFTEQMRMQDEDMAAALRRLRVRACTDADAALFNTNVLRSSDIPCGTTVTGKSSIIVLARTNETVRALNRHKASIQASTDRQDLVISHAIGHRQDLRPY